MTPHPFSSEAAPRLPTAPAARATEKVAAPHSVSADRNNSSGSQPKTPGATPLAPGSYFTSQQLAALALKLFRAGKDTVDIAMALGVPEHRASKLLWVARCHERRLPADFILRGAVRRIAA